jgi:branched-chain amino acid transport system substrate-binding protein
VSDRPTISRRRMLGLLAAGSALSACGSAAAPALAPPTPAAHAKVGVIWPQSGPNVGFGTDLKRGWDLWLQQNQGMLGDFVADVVPADEGTTPQAATAAVQKLLQTDKVDIIVGLVDNAAALAVIPLMNTAKKLLLVAGSGAADVTKKARNAYVWRTSFSDPQLAAPLGTQLAQSDARDGVYIVAPSDDQGTATIAGFQVAFESAGGRVAGTARLAPGVAPQRTITVIQRARPKATYCALAPANAAAFIKAYAQAGLATTIPLYGSGPITDGAVLADEGQAAAGVQSTLHYSDQLTTPVNTAFVTAYKAAYQDAPSCFSVQGYDSARVLSQALGEDVKLLDGDTLSNQMGKGAEYDSPRGRWKFDEQGPLQNVYLRKVQDAGGTLVNAVVFDLGVAGQPNA